jgi:uncharacterized zinc-type alcohol dehydrogenase-like protein
LKKISPFMPFATKAFAALSAATPLVPFQFNRRDLRPHDVLIDILFCGVCHSDLHQARDEWGGSLYPMVPGHEIIGRITQVGKAVTRFKPGDLAGVGVMVDSCRTCPHCHAGLEQYCDEGMTGTYNAYERDGKALAQGGYSTAIVTDEHFVVRVSDKLNPAATAPLLCAGITTYSPLRYVGVGPGTRVAVIGLGGLGHMGVKFAAAFGAEVALVSTSPGKAADAKRLGAHEFIHAADKAQMKKFRGHFNIVLNTVSAAHAYDSYLQLLALNGTMIVVGLPSQNPEVSPFSLLTNRRSILGSMVGGIAETQEMLDFCAMRNIVSDVEVIPIQKINEAYERMLRGDVRYRFVIDLASLK